MAAGEAAECSAEPSPRPALSPEVTARWQARFRAPRVSLPGWAEDAPHRCLYTSDVSGVVEQYAWDRADRRAPPGDRPAQRHAHGHPEPGRRHHLVVRRHRRRRVRRLADPAVRGRPGRRRRRRGRRRPIPPGSRSAAPLVAIGRSTDDGSELWLAPSGGAARVIYRHPDPASRRRPHPRRRAARRSPTPSTATRATRRCACSDRGHHRGRAGRRRREVGRRGARPARAGVRPAARRPAAAGRPRAARPRGAADLGRRGRHRDRARPRPARRRDGRLLPGRLGAAGRARPRRPQRAVPLRPGHRVRWRSWTPRPASSAGRPPGRTAPWSWPGRRPRCRR